MLSARLYSVETLNGFKEDPIFDPMFIKKHLGTVHSSIRTCIEEFTSRDCEDGGYDWDETFCPAVYSDVYAVKWWRFNSPTRFVPIDEHTPIVDFDYPLDVGSAEYRKLVAVKRDKLFDAVKDLTVPVCPIEMYDDLVAGHEQWLPVKLPIDSDRDFVASVYESATPVFDAFKREAEYACSLPATSFAERHAFSHIKLAYISVLADISRKAFPMLCDEDFYRFTGTENSAASHLIELLTQYFDYPFMRNPIFGQSVPRAKVLTATADTVFFSKGYVWTTPYYIARLLDDTVGTPFMWDV